VWRIILTWIIRSMNGDFFFRILKLLMDVNQIPEYNWRAYLLQCLNDIVVECKQNPADIFDGQPCFTWLVKSLLLLSQSVLKMLLLFLIAHLNNIFHWERCICLLPHIFLLTNAWNVIHCKIYKLIFILAMNYNSYTWIEFSLEEWDLKNDSF